MELTTLELYGFIFPYMNFIQHLFSEFMEGLKQLNNYDKWIQSFFLLTQSTNETSINGNFLLDKSSNQSLCLDMSVCVRYEI